MPHYEYACRDCSKKFEVVETVAKHEKTKEHDCPRCHSKNVERRVSSVFVETSKKS